MLEPVTGHSVTWLQNGWRPAESTCRGVAGRQAGGRHSFTGPRDTDVTRDTGDVFARASRLAVTAPVPFAPASLPDFKEEARIAPPGSAPIAKRPEDIPRPAGWLREALHHARSPSPSRFAGN
ncbi:hypothetical protein EYF80_023835 [Liparis tanakae]|uniref:Uncharacterized protein n=1 Tax=Liparis tanakae TaxID=230148 RepID=A0A4Z2HME8_9TELE|nr:hypothetical protein EYF80_023835 [Liparis tanakae]